MRRWDVFSLFWVTVVGLVLTAVLAAQTPAPKLTEVQQLKAQVQQLQEQLLQAQYNLATCNAQVQAEKLAEGRVALDKELQQTGFVFDWATLSYKPKPEAKP